MQFDQRRCETFDKHIFRKYDLHEIISTSFQTRKLLAAAYNIRSLFQPPGQVQKQPALGYLL